jgi:hypothetical protein
MGTIFYIYMYIRLGDGKCAIVAGIPGTNNTFTMIDSIVNPRRQ